MFSQSETPTRFNQCDKLNQLPPLIGKLTKKEKELKKAGEKNGFGSIDNRKYLVISKLMKMVNKEIELFNQNPPFTDPEKEVIAIREVVKKLTEVVNPIREIFNPTLILPRNNNRENAKAMINIGTKGAALIASSALSFGVVGTLLSLFWVAPKISNEINATTGLDAEAPDTILLLDELRDTLNAIGENLGLEKNWSKRTEPVYPDLTCMITGKIMEDPVFCTLDERTYERTAIEKWLSENGSAPFNRAPLPPHLKISDVLKPNRTFKELIDQFREKFPEFFDNERESIQQKLTGGM